MLRVDTEGDDDIQICESEPSKKKPAPPAAEDGVICIE